MSTSKDGPTLRAAGQALGAIGVIASLVFVALEIRQSTVAARAAALQEIGIATAEMWSEIARDEALLRLHFDRTDPVDATADDWSRYMAQMLAWSRLGETAFLQVQQGLLPESSLELLGYESNRYWLQNPALACLWEYRLKAHVGAQFRAHVESGPAPVEVDCEEFDFPFPPREVR